MCGNEPCRHQRGGTQSFAGAVQGRDEALAALADAQAEVVRLRAILTFLRATRAGNLVAAS